MYTTNLNTKHYNIIHFMLRIHSLINLHYNFNSKIVALILESINFIECLTYYISFFSVFWKNLSLRFDYI